MGTDGPFIDAVCAALSDGLATDGFARAPALDRLVDGVRLTVWRRDGAWKDKLVEVGHARGTPDHVLVHLRFELRGPPSSRALLDGTTAAGVIGRQGSALVSEPVRLAARVALAAIRGPRTWRHRRPSGKFDGYATPAICLAKLNSGETLLGAREGAVLRGPRYLPRRYDAVR